VSQSLKSTPTESDKKHHLADVDSLFGWCQVAQSAWLLGIVMAPGGSRIQDDLEWLYPLNSNFLASRGKNTPAITVALRSLLGSLSTLGRLERVLRTPTSTAYVM
jgi:hypothetical protein